MAEFKTWRAFHNFEQEVRENRRYLHSSDSAEFLQTVQDTSASRIYDLDKGRVLWRAQIGSDWEHISQTDQRRRIPYSRTRMKPSHDAAFEGRINPKGIPCLYLSTTAEAAMSEVRPWIGSVLSVARFETSRTLRIIDCAQKHAEPPRFHFVEPSPIKREEEIWAQIDRAFARPVARSDDTADYVATQILAELFRSFGCDGIAYKSSFGELAYTIALFDAEGC